MQFICCGWFLGCICIAGLVMVTGVRQSPVVAHHGCSARAGPVSSSGLGSYVARHRQATEARTMRMAWLSFQMKQRQVSAHKSFKALPWTALPPQKCEIRCLEHRQPHSWETGRKLQALTVSKNSVGVQDVIEKKNDTDILTAKINYLQNL